MRWTGDQLVLLDQRQLPHAEVYRNLTSWREVVDAIASMAVRGAPAIGVAAAWGVVLAAQAGDNLEVAVSGLRAARPTAVNLNWALNRMLASDAARQPVDAVALASLAADIESEDRHLTRQLVDHGVPLLSQNCRVLHHSHRSDRHGRSRHRTGSHCCRTLVECCVMSGWMKQASAAGGSTVGMGIGSPGCSLHGDRRWCQWVADASQ